MCIELNAGTWCFKTWFKASKTLSAQYIQLQAKTICLVIFAAKQTQKQSPMHLTLPYDSTALPTSSWMLFWIGRCVTVSVSSYKLVSVDSTSARFCLIRCNISASISQSTHSQGTVNKLCHAWQGGTLWSKKGPVMRDVIYERPSRRDRFEFYRGNHWALRNQILSSSLEYLSGYRHGHFQCICHAQSSKSISCISVLHKIQFTSSTCPGEGQRKALFMRHRFFQKRKRVHTAFAWNTLHTLERAKCNMTYRSER